MSVSGISTNALNQSYSVFNMQQRRNAFQQLTQALQSGNLAQAQQAFGSLTANGLTGPGASTPVGQDLAALGQALQSGNLTSAQQAFAKLQSDAQQAMQSHHQHHGAGQKSGTATDSDGDNDGSGTTLNITA
ncbi:MAG TPA: hypothetical protein VNE16_07300 [Vicinamibacterales bacterium]|nr:hypothetical protein [Vicinamibacterales bacterium]